MDWITTFEPGILSASAGELSSGQGKGCVSCSLETTGEACMLLLSDWKACGGNAGEDKKDVPPYHQVEILAADAEGRHVADASLPVTIEVTGPGVLLGLENGDLADNTPYSSPSRKTKEGRLLAYIRRTGPGVLTVTAKAEGLPASPLTLEENR